MLTEKPAALRGSCELSIARDVRIDTDDPDVSLSGDLYLPAGTDPVPVLVTVQPYRKDISGISLEPTFRWFAERGYATMLVELRGTGASDGIARPKMDPGEGDDAVAAITWAARQPWCDGNVGMWGASSAGFTTLLAACRKPPALKAIIPMICPVDPGWDAFHHDGARVDLHQLVLWGGQMLVEQMIPPLTTNGEARRRWHRRLHDVDPFLVDLARHGPGDQRLRARAVDPTSITVPTLCVGGWRDLYADAMVRLYELVQGPKQLLVGPWTHTMPHDAPHEAIDFLPIALCWWDRWLRGDDNSCPQEPGVSLFVQGAASAWRGYRSWPPTKDEVVFATGADTTLSRCPPEPSERTGTVIAEYRSDPTMGALSGLWGIPNSATGEPLDQHDDDMRTVSATTTPIVAPLLVCGRPEITVRLAPGCDRVDRLVVKLTDVDPGGRSMFVTAGVTCPDGDGQEHRVVLRPTAYRFKAGNRLRIALSDADFPRLVPLPDSHTLRVVGIALVVPSADEDSSVDIDMPTLGSRGPALGIGSRWSITRDPVNDGIEVAIGGGASGVHTPEGHVFSKETDVRAIVRRAAPDAATTAGEHVATVRMNSGEVITATATVRCDQASMWAQGELSIDGLITFRRTWHATLEYGG